MVSCEDKRLGLAAEESSQQKACVDCGKQLAWSIDCRSGPRMVKAMCSACFDAQIE